MGDAWGFLLWIPILYGVYWLYRSIQKKAEIKAAGPNYQTIPAYETGSMKVDISFQQVPAKSSKHRLFGGDNWWRMHMNIRMSDEDWALFKKSGLIENELFSSPNVEFPEIEESFPGIGLQWMPAYRDFPNISDAEAAKEKLVHALHIIRARVDDMKSTKGGVPDRERFEI